MTIEAKSINIRAVHPADTPELQYYVGNRDVSLLRYYEPEPGLFVAEGRNVIEVAIRAGFEPINMVVTGKMIGDPVLEKVGDIPVFLVDEDEARQYFGYVLIGGISCVMRRRAPADFREIIKNARRIVVLEDVENPTNVGTIFRTAAALGIDAVLLSPACVDPLYRRALRVSTGNTALIPWAYVGKNEDDWRNSGIGRLRDEGFTTVAMALREDNVTIDDPVLKTHDKLAIVMGNEGFGLTETTINSCDYVAKIPMMNGVDSLNVAVAAGLAMWELRK